MNSTLIDPRKAIVGIHLVDGTSSASFSFPHGKPSYETLLIIVRLMVDGYKLASAETKPLHELPK